MNHHYPFALDHQPRPIFPREIDGSCRLLTYVCAAPCSRCPPLLVGFDSWALLPQDGLVLPLGIGQVYMILS